MIVISSGGTGKLTLLNAIMETFTSWNVKNLLAKTALSSVAATIIGGTTLHWWAGLPEIGMPNNDT